MEMLLLFPNLIINQLKKKKPYNVNPPSLLSDSSVSKLDCGCHDSFLQFLSHVLKFQINRKNEKKEKQIS